MIIPPLILGLLFLFGSMSFSPPRVELLYTTNYFPDEIKNQTGEEWFGFFKTEKGFELKKCVIEVEPIQDLCSEDKENEKTGRRVTVDQPEEPMILIRGLDSLREGELKTVYSGKDFLYPGQYLSMKWEEEDYYHLNTYGCAQEFYNGGPETEISNYSFHLFHGYQHSQVIPILKKVSNDHPPVILWIGDLDRDNKPDLLIDQSPYMTECFTLYLSSMAEGDDFVKKVAQFYKQSC